MITINNKITNAKKLPAIYNNVDADAGSPTQYPEGFLLIDTLANRILINVSGSWVDVTSGSGSTPNLQQVLDTGNNANDKSIVLQNLVSDLKNTYGDGYAAYVEDLTDVNHYMQATIQQIIFKNSASVGSRLRFDYLEFNVLGIAEQRLLPNQSFAAKSTLPETDGTLALQDPPLQFSINSSPYTPNATYNRIYRVIAGASSIVLNPSNWIDRRTLTFCFDVTAVTFSVTGGATLRGIALINVTGLYYVTYLSSVNTFYLSHTA